MTQAELLALIDRTFPFVPRPSPEDIPFHNDDCAHCYFTTQFLLKHPGPRLPRKAIRWLYMELSTLSAKTTSWVLPSYLRYVLTEEEERDPQPTEFLIYTLGPSPQYASETTTRLSLLTCEQIDTLIALMGYLGENGWREYCSDDLDRAVQFLNELGERRSR